MWKNRRGVECVESGVQGVEVELYVGGKIHCKIRGDYEDIKERGREGGGVVEWVSCREGFESEVCV